jgi:hypothetical protein
MVTTDIYIGENLNIWHDGESAFIDMLSNGLTFVVPLEDLAELFTEFAHAQSNFQVQEINKN